MLNHKWSLCSALAAATLCFSFSAFAYGHGYTRAHHHNKCNECPPLPPEDKASEGFIIGIEAGYVNTNWSNINQNAFAANQYVIQNDYNAGGRVYAGYVTNKYVAYELGYTYLGNVDVNRWDGFSRETRPLTRIDNWALDAVIRLSAPIYGNAGLFATFGAAYLVSDDTVRWNANQVQQFSDPVNLQHVASYQATFGFGAYRDIDCHMRVEIFWKHFEGSSTTDDQYQPSPDFYAVGFVYRI
ncbi:MAG: outer membrane beta-barrel protein [Pseudomonadota bacterium]|nr:outer membrane beta-barrel protein [Pseudomonadota bacterium]